MRSTHLLFLTLTAAMCLLSAPAAFSDDITDALTGTDYTGRYKSGLGVTLHDNYRSREPQPLPEEPTLEDEDTAFSDPYNYYGTRPNALQSPWYSSQETDRHPELYDTDVPLLDKGLRESGDASSDYDNYEDRYDYGY